MATTSTLALTMGASSASAQVFSVVEVPTFGGLTSFAHAINGTGQVVGYATTAEGLRRAFVFSDGAGTLTPLGTLGGSESFAFAINNTGEITGYSNTANGSEHAFRYSSGTMTDLGTLGGVSSYGFAINDAGEIAGGSTRDLDLQYTAYRTTSTGLMSLGSLGGFFGSSEALGIDADGTVVGWTSTLNFTQHAFVYRNGTMTDLGTLGGNYSYAEAIRDGVIVGGSFTLGDLEFRAFVHQNGTMTPLGVLPEFVNSTAYALNGSGMIVGKSDDGTNDTAHATLFLNGLVIDLNDLVDPASGWVLRQARGINDAGQIVGFGSLNGSDRGFLLNLSGKIWTNPAGGDFATAGNWFSAGAPAAAQPAAFVLDGTYTVNIPSPAASGPVSVAQGNVTFDAPGTTYAISGGLHVRSGATLTLQGGGTVSTTGPLAIGDAAQLVISGGSTVTAPVVESLGTIRIGAGQVKLSPGGGTSVTRALEIGGTTNAWSGQLDLADNALAIDYDAATPIEAVRDQVRTGSSGGLWIGNGIVSSQADASAYGIGFAEASALYSTFPADFAGRAVDNTAVLLKLTRYGDANLDEVVNLSDFNALAANFGGTGKVWSSGDFNYDGLVNLTDFNLLASNFGLSAGPEGPTPDDWATLAAAVPEPSVAVLLSVSGAAALLFRRRRAVG